MFDFLKSIVTWLQETWNYIYENITDLNIIVQISSTLLIVFVSLFAKRIISKYFFENLRKQKNRFGIIITFCEAVLVPFFSLILLLLIKRIFDLISYPSELIQVFISLASLWVIIIISTFFISNPLTKKIVLFFSMMVAIISSFGYLNKTIELLDSLAVSISGSRISIYTIIKAIIFLAIFGWIAKQLVAYLQNSLSRSKSIKPSLAVLIIKISKITVYCFVFLLVISNVGINLKAFTILTGAIGIGVGFGLQKVVSNLISGVILLLDESIRPGDVIEVGEDFGWIKTMGARYIEVISIDGKEFIIPNEELITTKVINWSHSNNLIRIDVNIGVSYKSNPHTVKEILLSVPKQFPRIQTNPEPACFLKGFGDSSINFTLKFWINDPKNGIDNIKSDVLLTIWDQFNDANIEIPFPQRDIYIKEFKTNDSKILQ